MSKRDTMTVLDELRSRVQQSSPQQSFPQQSFRQQSSPPPFSSQPSPPLHLSPQNSVPQWNKTLPQRPSIDSMSMSFRSFASSRKPSTAGTLPSQVDESSSRGSGLSRFLSARRNAHKRVSSSSSLASSTFVSSLMPTQEMLMPGLLQQMEDPQYELPAAEIERPLRDIKVPIPEPDNHLHPALNRDSTASRATSSSTSDRVSTQSDFSDEKISVLSEPFEYEEVVRPPTDPLPAEIASALPPTHSRLYSSSYATQLPPMTLPTSPISTVSMRPSPIALGSGNASDDVSLRTYPRPMTATTTSSVYSQSSSYQPSYYKSINESNVTIKAPKHLTGRPDKHNNYWGFCKGSWTIRSDWRKGLSIYEVPTGMYNTKTVWKCKHCSFEGDVFGTKKSYDIDQKVYQTGDSGVQYRWLFLAKSHTKRKSVLPSMGTAFLKGPNVEEKSYGCVFCIGEGKESSIYGNVERLCEHLISEHGSGSGSAMSEKLMAENKCIVGRRAGKKEDFDVNIPHVVEIA